jgi:Short C-terminal domain
MLGHDWQPAEGTCVEADWETRGSEKWIMDVRPLDGSAPFRLEVGHPGTGEDFRHPYSGQVCKMLVDVKKQKAKFDPSDPTLSRKAFRQMERDRLRAELNSAPGSGALPAAGYHLGASTTYQVVGGADAAPLLNALLGGNSQEQRTAALRALHEARQNPDGLMGAFAAQVQAAQAQAQGMAAQAQGGQVPGGAVPAPAPFGAGPADPAPNVARFGGDPVPASFGGPVPASFGGPVPASFGGPTTESADDLSSRLAKLQALHSQGLLSKAEFQAQRQRILDSI